MSIYCKKARSNFSTIALVLLGVTLFLGSCKNAKNPAKKTEAHENSALQGLEKKLGVKIPSGSNRAYYEEIASWLGAPYKYGGKEKSGTDCSGFVLVVYQRVFKILLDHQSSKQKEKSRTIKESELKEGDLYFFKLDGKKISHVGMHVAPDYFVHASTKRGVVVSKLSEPYYSNAFAGFGTYR
jgi:cell wall-associated NlpC family hydrolase